MREILFRGKCRETGNWCYGDVVEYGMDWPVIVDDFNPAACNYTEVESDSVGQYTGLNDKNGNKIFEGDIVDIDDGDGWVVGRGVVEYKNGCFMVGGGFMDGRIETVIGNIHENPELLKEGE